MSEDRKLRLVPPLGGRSDGDAEDAAVSEAELREADELRELLERGEQPLADALRSAYEPRPLDEDQHDRLLARVGILDEPIADAPDETAELRAALVAAWNPASIDPGRNELLIAKALSRLPTKRRAASQAVAIGGTFLAMAAAVALWFSTAKREPVAEVASRAPVVAVTEQLIPSRSTAELFEGAEPFPRSGGESERIDRIATARAADLRANRFARWGVH